MGKCFFKYPENRIKRELFTYSIQTTTIYYLFNK